MAKRIAFLVLIASMLSVSFQPEALAQAPAEGQSRAGGPRKQVAIIVFSGLSGAILGLSTLSFYGRPQDRLSNIGVGFAIGIIVGATYTTYQAATRPREFYDSDWRLEGPESWQEAKLQDLKASQEAPGLGLSFSF